MSRAKGKAKGKFEQSRYDNDKGVREGSNADKKRDKSEKKAFAKAKK